MLSGFLALLMVRITELETWLHNELNGYSESEIPDYREIHGEIEAWNPYHGWIPVIFESAKVAGSLSKRKVILIKQLQENIDSIELTPDDHKEVINELEKVTDEVKNQKPDATKVKKSLKTIGSILEKAASSLVASGLIHGISKFIG
ncbi:hypothetical protein LJR153_007245 [Paenibacillus sp. LjRoot153]|uniref:AbiTii domain-containing protein n=1 Tax=Paenibacillus sp. LjRoot153 TaxID=3342270 RepID=UPI003ECEB9C1